VSDSAQIGFVSDSAQIGSVYDSAQIRFVYDSAQIELAGEAVVSAYSAKKIVCKGYNTIIIHKSDKNKINLVMNKESHLVILPDNKLKTNPDFNEFAMRFGIDKKGTKAILYKAVHKKDGVYFSDYKNSFVYEVGKVITHEIDNQNNESCSVGLHIASKHWALLFGKDWDDMALLECEVPIKKIIVAKDCDGKVRTSELKVLREVPKEEWFNLTN
jgi:hypothetical protein